MKKLKLVLPVLFFYLHATSQIDVGYRTTDIGIEYQHFNDGSFVGLHFAANAKIHHSFHTTIGYYIAGNKPTASYYNDSKGGLGFNLGYRYYVKPRPDGLFIGIKTNLFINKIMLNTQTPEGPYTSMIFIPAVQTGFMLLINDAFFITPSIEGGFKTNLQNKLSADKGKGVFLAGISCGFKI